MRQRTGDERGEDADLAGNLGAGPGDERDDRWRRSSGEDQRGQDREADSEAAFGGEDGVAVIRTAPCESDEGDEQRPRRDAMRERVAAHVAGLDLRRRGRTTRRDGGRRR